MNNDILMLLVGAFISASVAFFFWIIKRIIDKKDKSNISLQYLENFYAPIYNQIQSRQIITMIDAIKSIDSISKNHPQAIPKYFMEWRRLKDYYIKYNYSENKLDKDFVNHIEANYIWLRRKFKYDKQKVLQQNLHYLDCYKKKNSIADSINIFMYYFLIIPLMIGLLLLLDNNQSIVAYMLLSSSVFGFLVSLIKDFSNKWGS